MRLFAWYANTKPLYHTNTGFDNSLSLAYHSEFVCIIHFEFLDASHTATTEYRDAVSFFGVCQSPSLPPTRRHCSSTTDNFALGPLDLLNSRVDCRPVHSQIFDHGIVPPAQLSDARHGRNGCRTLVRGGCHSIRSATVYALPQDRVILLVPCNTLLPYGVSKSCGPRPYWFADHNLHAVGYTASTCPFLTRQVSSMHLGRSGKQSSNELLFHSVLACPTAY